MVVHIQGLENGSFMSIALTVKQTKHLNYFFNAPILYSYLFNP